jgi:hypothetical protein
MQTENTADEAAHVDNVHVVVRLDREGPHHLFDFQVWQQVENVLEVVHDLLVVLKGAVHYFLEIDAHLL